MYLVVSFSYKNTEISLREKLNFNKSDSLAMLEILSLINEIDEVMLLSTCNRVEFYIYSKEHNQEKEEEIIKKFISKLVSFKRSKDIMLDENELLNKSFLSNLDAVHHIFSVASSLDSIVIGETQIVDQLKNALRLSKENNFCTKELPKLIQFAFKCATRVRNESDISKNSISIASVAVNNAMSRFNISKFKDELIPTLNVLVIGAGEIGILCLKHLLKFNLKITATNRTIENLKNISFLDFNRIEILDFKNLEQKLNDFDLVFSAITGNIINISKNLTKNQVIFDLAIPRSINLKFNKLREIITIDDLNEIVNNNLALKRANTRIAFGIVGKSVIEFQNHCENVNIDPLIKTLRLNAKNASMKEINRAIKKGFIPEALRENIQKLLHSAFNEFLHAPTIKLKLLPKNKDSIIALNSIEKIFGNAKIEQNEIKNVTGETI